MQKSNTRSSVFTWTVIAVGLTAVGDSVRLMAAATPDWRWVTLTALTLLGAAAVLKMRAGLSLSISDTFTFTVLYLLGPAPATVTAALEALGGSVLLSRGQRTIRRVLFNIGAVGLAMRLAGSVFAALVDRHAIQAATGTPLRLMPPMLLAAGVYFLTNTALVAAAVSLDRCERFVAIWRTHLAHLSLSFFGGAYVALLLTLLSPTLNVAGSLLLMPMPLLLYAVYRAWHERVNDQIAFLDSTNRQYKATIAALAHAVDAKDQVTHGHIQRVQATCLALAARLGARDDTLVKALEAASLLHDLGKIAIPEHILNKPGRLTDAEYTRMKEHASIGAEILSAIDFPYPVVPIVRHHHENWDGSGYPDGLRGEAIPLGARILAVVDCFDALTSDRPYRPRMTADEAFEILRQRRGQMYDPAVVDTFIEMQQASNVFEVEPSEGSGDPRRMASSTPDTPASVAVSVVERLDAHVFDGVGEPVLQLACERVGAAAGVVLAYDGADDTLRAALVCGALPAAMRNRVLRRGEGLTGWVAAVGRPQINSDARLDFGGSAAVIDPRLKIAVSVPITRGPALLGVMTLYGPEPLADAQLPAVELLASVIARGTIGAPA